MTHSFFGEKFQQFLLVIFHPQQGFYLLHQKIFAKFLFVESSRLLPFFPTEILKAFQPPFSPSFSLIKARSLRLISPSKKVSYEFPPAP
jgi:hypothetical protein